MRIRLAWQLVLGTLLALGASSVSANEKHGAQVYQQQCARCHGATGQGTDENYPEPLVGDNSVAQLGALIAETMPADTDQKCSPDDARAVAQYVYDAFYSPDAQLRNKPARVQLSRLTIRQYQNAVTDLIASFRPTSAWGGERGLRGRYYAARIFRPDAVKIERTDAQVNFDFGNASPDGHNFDADEFSISWEGSVFAPDTGTYEFVVRTEHATRLFVNDNVNPLVDAWVKSRDDGEARAEIRLLGGRAYPIKLEFSKFTQGVANPNRKKKVTKSATAAAVSLHWKRPHHTLEVIPSRNLSALDSPSLFVLHAPFPPDDRSTGFERGIAISKSWDDATTEAAIEVAGYVSDHINELAGVADDAADREARLIDFCHTFAERAFRRPLTDEQRLTYVDRQFAEAADPKLAVRRVLLLVLKSPRFLYHDPSDDGAADGYDVASRISFGLWDSIPDDRLRSAAAYGRLANAQDISLQLQRMLADSRTRAKLREFLLTWLKVSQPPDVTKDPHAYPEFSPDSLSDLRTSLELSIDDVLESKSVDYRQLMLGDSIFLNGALAAIYGADLPKDAPFTKVQYQPEHRAGLVSHPYLLACFAYANASSPIHRGVFISRNLLGRTLRQPPEAVAPLPVEVHADLTTRERVALQTQPEMCQTCHHMINPLGFSLENFDAIGRFRERDKERAIDTAGSYITQSGSVVKFDGAVELASFLASNEESQAAFVRQLFHHLIKQPIQAYGPNCWPRLQKEFVHNNFNINKLAAEIVSASLLPYETGPPSPHAKPGMMIGGQ